MFLQLIVKHHWQELGRKGGGVILYIKESIQAYEIKLEKEAECEVAVWCDSYRKCNINY